MTDIIDDAQDVLARGVELSLEGAAGAEMDRLAPMGSSFFFFVWMPKVK